MFDIDRFAIDLVSEQGATIIEPAQRTVLQIRIGTDAFVLAAIEPIGPEKAGGGQDAEFIQQRFQIDAAPYDIADAARRDPRVRWVPGALVERFHLAFRHLPEFVEGEGGRLAHKASDGERPVSDIDVRYAYVG